MARYLELSFELGPLEAQRAEDACLACGASAVTFLDARDDPVLEPLPGEFRLWPATRVTGLFQPAGDSQALVQRLAAALGIDARLIEARELAERDWEREWLRHSHPVRFGRRLWVCPHHERVTEPGAVVVALDAGLAFGTGAHPSTALCLGWLDACLSPGTRVIDYGCGSGVLALAAAKLGAGEVHCYDIDPQALTATRDNALLNGVAHCVRVHDSAATLPAGVDLLLANIVSATLCALAPRFAALLRPRGAVLLAGLLEQELADVTAAYATWFDVARVDGRDGWACLAGRRRL